LLHRRQYKTLWMYWHRHFVPLQYSNMSGVVSDWFLSYPSSEGFWHCDFPTQIYCQKPYVTIYVNLMPYYACVPSGKLVKS
jgi:hypothetical protein